MNYELNHFTVIYAVCFTVLTGLLILMQYLRFNKKKATLGKSVFEADMAIQFGGKFKYIMRMLIFVVFYGYVVVMYGSKVNVLVIIATIAVAYLESKFVLEPLMFSQKLGLYENGAITMTGAIRYDEATRYGYRNAQNGLLLVIQGKYDFREGGSCIYINNSDRSRINQLLKKKVEYGVIGKK